VYLTFSYISNTLTALKDFTFDQKREKSLKPHPPNQGGKEKKFFDPILTWGRVTIWEIFKIFY
jgi:hypothetical protein